MTCVEVYLYICHSTTVHTGRALTIQSLSNTPDTLFLVITLCPFSSVTEWTVENKGLGHSWICSVLQEC